jgi:hypothetical protein
MEASLCQFEFHAKWRVVVCHLFDPVAVFGEDEDAVLGCHMLKLSDLVLLHFEEMEQGASSFVSY